eukprot:5195049-Alexandrium_andersonii.AAC.1
MAPHGRNLGVARAAAGLVATFDGGVRQAGVGRVVGAGAALWSAPLEDGSRSLLDCATAALPVMDTR